MKLVIVESPTKAKTISAFLKNGYKLTSSYGHIRDLPKSQLGVDTENDFQPKYVIPTKARKRINELKKEAQTSDEVILATDEDREGEAIAWHLKEVLGLKPAKAKRIVFHEITKGAIEEALKKPRDIDMNLVNAQQARRILDRLVGYELSPFLWKKVFRGLSAGRVQSAALRLIVEREREIENFVPQEYWDIVATLLKIKDQKSNLKDNSFKAKLIKKDKKLLDKFAIKPKGEAEKISRDLEKQKFIVSKIEKKEVRRQPKPPFTTSTLQQEAANQLGYSAKQTMLLAQQLYEQGFITYMRTDSVNLSAESTKKAKQLIEENFGKQYALASPRKFKAKSRLAQEAHEAIRPTRPEIGFKELAEKSQNSLKKEHIKLYELIWRRFLASQMKEAVFDSTTIDIKAGDYGLRANGQILKFDGWLKIYPSQYSENILPKLEEGEELKLKEIIPSQHFTEPPPRYNEASLVKTLEEYGIGRPSTYAPIISTIQERNYVIKNAQKRFEPTETGFLVNDILVEHFPQIVDLNFTAQMEEKLDEIAAGKAQWVPVIREFYIPFHQNLEKKYQEVEKQNLDQETSESCEKCGKPMLIKQGRFGKFLACSGFPECKNTKAIKREPEKVGMKCPECGEGEIVKRYTKKRRLFYGCSKWPDCKFASWKNPQEKTPNKNKKK